MNDELTTSFLTHYVQCLRERTRDEKDGTKFGFDWIVYNLCVQSDWTPHRLPFIRTAPGGTPKTKTEPEFGVDLAFLSKDRKTLRVFVLKDEVLNNKNWTKNDFDTDLRNASAPDLTAPELGQVQAVEIILAYNKDEDRAGIELFERRAAAQGTSIRDGVTLSFERWNLTRLVDEVSRTLLSPALLPLKFYSQFSYICSQFADFEHGSDEWTRQLVPNWKNFLLSLLSKDADERSVRLVPVALIVLSEYGREKKTRETGWIELVEWGALAAWAVANTSQINAVKFAVAQIWVSFYLVELERYYQLHANDLAVAFSLDRLVTGGLVDAVATGVVAHWHLARLGILAIGYSELLPAESDDQKESKSAKLNDVADWLAGFLHANPSTMRPIIDLHHLQLFLAWHTFAQVGRFKDLHDYLSMLLNRLFIRRAGKGEIPFIEGGNSLELVFEHVALGERPVEYCDSSSVYLMCLMELVCVLSDTERDSLLELIYRRLVLGNADCGTRMDGCKPIDLMLWSPSEGWERDLLTKTLANTGDCATVDLFGYGQPEPKAGSEIAAAIQSFVRQSRTKRKFEFPPMLPLSALTLTCLKHHSPLPPEVWRRRIFEDETPEECNAPG